MSDMLATLGQRACAGGGSADDKALLASAWRAVRKMKKLQHYLAAAEPWIQFAATHFSVSFVQFFLSLIHITAWIATAYLLVNKCLCFQVATIYLPFKHVTASELQQYIFSLIHGTASEWQQFFTRYNMLLLTNFNNVSPGYACYCFWVAIIYLHLKNVNASPVKTCYWLQVATI